MGVVNPTPALGREGAGLSLTTPASARPRLWRGLLLVVRVALGVFGLVRARYPLRWMLDGWLRNYGLLNLLLPPRSVTVNCAASTPTTHRW